MNVYFAICFTIVTVVSGEHRGLSLTSKNSLLAPREVPAQFSSLASALELQKKRQSTNTQMKLVADNLAGYSRFGWSAALSSDGKTALIGAYLKNEGGFDDAGTSYVFVRNGAGQWSQQKKLLANDLEANAGFGWSTALSSDGNTALIGAYGKDEGAFGDTGASYVFIRNGTGHWSQQMKLVANDLEKNARLGWSAALSSDGNTALIGALWKDAGGLINAGAAYVFIRNGTGHWSQQKKLVADDVEAHAYFGRSAALSSDGNTALIGASDKNEGGLNAGASYVFICNGTGQWSQQVKLVADELETDAWFGWSAALSSDGNTALIGAEAKNEGNFSDAGASYVFIRNDTGQWSQQMKLAANDLQVGANFGSSVALSSDGNTALIGSYRKNEGGFDEAGASYVFIRRNGVQWSQQMKLVANDLEAGAYFGYSAAISSDGNTALLGVYYKDVGVIVNAGASYVFTIPPPTLSPMKLVANDLEASAYFGESVALSSDGNTALIGAYHVGLNDAGASYVFTHNGTGWSQPMKLVANLEALAQFGRSVALSSDGNTALIGAPLSNEEGFVYAGAAYVFTRNGGQWSQPVKLVANNDLEASSWFGRSVTLSADGNTALIGAYNRDEGGLSARGAAYVFTRNGGQWSQPVKLVAALGANAFFGWSVALSSDGNTSLIGAYNADVSFVFTRNGSEWSQSMKLEYGDLDVGAKFGYSVALSSDGGTALIGAYAKNEGTFAGAGAAYVFTRNGMEWSQQMKLVANNNDLEAGAYFGKSVALSSDGNTALIGAYGKTNKGFSGAGVSYIFTRNGGQWSQQMKLMSIDPEADANFGWSVALSSNGNAALIGAYAKDEGSFGDAGATYLFTALLPPTPSPTAIPTTGTPTSLLPNTAPSPTPPPPLPSSHDPASPPAPAIDGMTSSGLPAATGIDPTTLLSTSVSTPDDTKSPTVLPESNHNELGAPTTVVLVIAGVLLFCGILVGSFVYRRRTKKSITGHGPGGTSIEAPLSTLRGHSRSVSDRRRSVGRPGSTGLYQLPPNPSSSQELKRSPRSGSRSRSHSKSRSRSRSRSSRRSQQHNLSFGNISSLNMAVVPGAADTHTLEVESRHVIDQSELSKTKLLGSGNFGEVWKADWQGVAVAVKEVKGMDQASTDQLILEAQRFQSLRAHPNVVAFYGVVLQPTLAVVMEFCPNGSLDEALYGEEGKRSFSSSQLLTIARGIVLGVAHLHRANIIHRDLAARNVLLDGMDNPKVTDFGMSREQTGNNQTTQTEIGPVKWMAPEQLKEKSVSKQADIWALGVVLYEVFAQQRPWAGKQNVEVAHLVMKGKSLDPPPQAPVEVKQAMRACFHPDPSKRPNAVQLAEQLASEPVYQEISTAVLENYDIISLSGTPTSLSNQYVQFPKQTASSSTTYQQQPPRAPTGHQQSYEQPPRAPANSSYQQPPRAPGAN